MTGPSPSAAARIIQSAGGQIVGRIRLQKVGYLLEQVGLGDGFSFSYHHYGPYSEQLAITMNEAVALELVHEDAKLATWGGAYSVYTTQLSARAANAAKKEFQRSEFARLAASFNPIALELLATAVFVARESRNADVWGKVRELKATKATNDNVTLAFEAYCALSKLDVPKTLPKLNQPTAA